MLSKWTAAGPGVKLICMGRKAFSIVELIISCAIVTIVFVVGFGSLVKGRSQAGAQGLSLALADVFRQARQEALARR